MFGNFVEKKKQVHNYRPGAFLTSIRCTDFVRELEQQYQHHSFGNTLLDV
jgi:hypothetical protein